MAVHIQNPENYMVNYYVGQQFGQLEIIAIHEEDLELSCGCGTILTRPMKKFSLRPAYSCRTCSKSKHADSVLASGTNNIAIRENTPIEQLMLKEATIGVYLTVTEQQILSDHRKSIRRKSAIRSKMKSERGN